MMDTTYLAESCPVLTRVISAALLGPSKTILLGIMSKLPCAARSKGERKVSITKPVMKNNEVNDLIHPIIEFVNLVIVLRLSFN
jgi:hypothetical protein